MIKNLLFGNHEALGAQHALQLVRNQSAVCHSRRHDGLDRAGVGRQQGPGVLDRPGSKGIATDKPLLKRACLEVFKNRRRGQRLAGLSNLILQMLNQGLSVGNKLLRLRQWPPEPVPGIQRIMGWSDFFLYPGGEQIMAEILRAFMKPLGRRADCEVCCVPLESLELLNGLQPPGGCVDGRTLQA